MVSGHSGWSFWKASAMAERSASTQTVILAVGSCVTAGEPYWPPVEEPADSVGPLVGVPEPAVPGVPDGLLADGLFPQPAATRAMQAAAADTPINLRGALRSCKDTSLLLLRFVRLR